MPNLRVRLYPEDDHWVMLQKAVPVAKDIRGFIEDKNFPKESVYRGPAKSADPSAITSCTIPPRGGTSPSRNG